MKKYLQLIRVKHYIKNILIFLPLVFGMQLFSVTLLSRAAVGFAAFCAISSAVYIINDLRDVEHDRRHITKKNRPVASGAVSKKAALAAAALLVAVAAALNIYAGGASYKAWLFMGLYFVLNLLYSFGLKLVPVLDVCILASGFLLRVLYGSAVVGIQVSGWLYLTVLAGSFWLGLSKRRGELSGGAGGETREVLSRYSREFLDKNMYMCMTLAIVFYSLWCVDPSTAARVGNHAMVWTVPLVIMCFMKYNLTAEKSAEGDPVEVLFGDKLLLTLCCAVGLAIAAIVYI